ncbi:SRPBCC family protein [Actinosynnema sp. NPDC002837]
MGAEATTEIVVHKTVTVPLGVRRTFELFTARMTDFWPSEHSIGTAPLAEVVVEPREGGRWFERGEDGSECSWGRVARWSPPNRLVLLWQIGADWTYDPSLETEVEIDFVEESPDRTRLELRHRHLERFGERAEALRAAFDGLGGWSGTLTRFAEFAR